MIAHGKYLYVVETNRGMLLRVDPRKGAIKRVYDMSIDEAEHNPIVMTRRGNDYFVGTFGEDGGPAELAKFDKDFSGYTLPFQSLNPIVGLAWHGNRLYGVEIFPYDNPWTTDTANLVTFDPRTGERRQVLTGFASLPNGLVKGPDGALYTSNQGVSFSAHRRRRQRSAYRSVSETAAERRGAPAPRRRPERSRRRRSTGVGPPLMAGCAVPSGDGCNRPL